MLEILQAATSYIPLLLYGAPGIGKTEIVRQHFDHTELVLTSTMVEEDIAGLPFRDGDYDYRTIPAIFRNIEEADKAGKTTCVFLDELDKSRRSVADTLLTFVASRSMGRASLPDKTVIIAAANPPIFGGGDGISDAMRSRFCVVDAQPDVRRWCEWARASFEGVHSHAIIQAIESGDVPLVDIAGEEMDKRITCPRTLTMLMRHIETRGMENMDCVKTLADGLLTANAASRLLLALNSLARDTDVVSKSRSVRSGYLQNKKHNPIRL